MSRNGNKRKRYRKKQIPQEYKNQFQKYADLIDEDRAQQRLIRNRAVDSI